MSSSCLLRAQAKAHHDHILRDARAKGRLPERVLELLAGMQRRAERRVRGGVKIIVLSMKIYVFSEMLISCRGLAGNDNSPVNEDD